MRMTIVDNTNEFSPVAVNPIVPKSTKISGCTMAITPPNSTNPPIDSTLYYVMLYFFCNPH